MIIQSFNLTTKLKWILAKISNKNGSVYRILVQYKMLLFNQLWLFKVAKSYPSNSHTFAFSFHFFPRPYLINWPSSASMTTNGWSCCRIPRWERKIEELSAPASYRLLPKRKNELPSVGEVNWKLGEEFLDNWMKIFRTSSGCCWWSCSCWWARIAKSRARSRPELPEGTSPPPLLSFQFFRERPVRTSAPIWKGWNFWVALGEGVGKFEG